MSTLNESPTVHCGVDPQAGAGAACRTIDLSQGKKAARNMTTIFRGLTPGEHTVQVTVRQGPVEFDGYVVQAPVAP